MRLSGQDLGVVSCSWCRVSEALLPGPSLSLPHLSVPMSYLLPRPHFLRKSFAWSSFIVLECHFFSMSSTVEEKGDSS